jgi:hypothetical protein
MCVSVRRSSMLQAAGLQEMLAILFPLARNCERQVCSTTTAPVRIVRKTQTRFMVETHFSQLLHKARS